jgi:hypothetical protein
MMDGLRWRDHPGPLIIVVAFVGFVVVAKQVLGPDRCSWCCAGRLRRRLVHFFAVLHLILAGGPVESTARQPQLHRPAGRITAEPIANLALFFFHRCGGN